MFIKVAINSFIAQTFRSFKMKMSVKIILAMFLMLATNSENNSTEFIEDQTAATASTVPNVPHQASWSTIFGNFQEEFAMDLLNSNTSFAGRKNRRDSDLPENIDEEVNWNDILNNEKLVKEILKRLQSHPTIVASPTPYLLYTNTPKPSKHGHSRKHFKRRRIALEIALMGTIDQLRQISRRKVLEILENKEMINVSLQRKLILWEIFKNDKRVGELTVSDLIDFGDLLMEIPENDLYKLNVTNMEILEYLGTMEHMTRRRASILLYAIKNKSNDSFITNTTVLNSIKGIICGLPSRRLRQIDTNLIQEIKDEVFTNLWACNQEQLNDLLDICMKNTIYKNIETWSNETIKRLGFLLTALKPEQIKKLEANILNSLEGKTLAKFDRQQIAAFTQSQIRNFNPETLAVYYNCLLTQSSSEQISQFYILILYLAIFYALKEIFLYY